MHESSGETVQCTNNEYQEGNDRPPKRILKKWGKGKRALDKRVHKAERIVSSELKDDLMVLAVHMTAKHDAPAEKITKEKALDLQLENGLTDIKYDGVRKFIFENYIQQRSGPLPASKTVGTYKRQREKQIAESLAVEPMKEGQCVIGASAALPKAMLYVTHMFETEQLGETQWKISLDERPIAKESEIAVGITPLSTQAKQLQSEPCGNLSRT